MFDQLGGPTFWKDMYGNENPSGWIKYYSRFEFIRQSALAKCLTWQADALEKMKAAPNNWHLTNQALDEWIVNKRRINPWRPKSLEFVSPFVHPNRPGRRSARRQSPTGPHRSHALRLQGEKRKVPPTLNPPNFPADPFGKGPFVYDTLG